MHLTLDPHPKSARLAREFVTHAVSGLEKITADALSLLTSEVVTNAILHARTTMHVGVVHNDEHVLVTVQDENSVRPEQQPYDDQRSGGRGMALVDRLAEHWGVATQDAGKCIWFLVARGADPTQETA